MESLSFKFFQQNAIPADPRDIKKLMKEYSTIVIPFKPTSEEIQHHWEFYKSLKKESRFWREPVNEQILEILLEEWIFLQGHSWIVSRIKKTFNKFKDAGGIYLQVGKRTFKKLVRKTIKKSRDEILTRADILRAFGKWVAVGGPKVLSAMFHIEIPWEVDLIKDFFILFDPENGNYNGR